MSNAKIDLTLTGNRAVASMVVPGFTGTLVTRHGKDDREALASALRALADLVDSRRRDSVRANVETDWVRISLDVDVRVPTAESDRAEKLESQVMEGNRSAGVELLSLSEDWLRAALDDKDSREFQSFSWSHREDCEEFDEA